MDRKISFSTIRLTHPSILMPLSTILCRLHAGWSIWLWILREECWIEGLRDTKFDPGLSDVNKPKRVGLLTFPLQSLLLHSYYTYITWIHLYPLDIHWIYLVEVVIYPMSSSRPVPRPSGLSEQDQNLATLNSEMALSNPSPAKRRQSLSRSSGTKEQRLEEKSEGLPSSASFQLAVGKTEELSPRRKARRSMVSCHPPFCVEMGLKLIGSSNLGNLFSSLMCSRGKMIPLISPPGLEVVRNILLL